MANEVPVLQRTETAQPASSVPRYGKEMASLTAPNNWMGSIGAKVAQSASQALATELGTQSGKNPHGNLLPPISDFDKHYSDAYSSQAGAELTLQANKLLSDSEIKLANATKLTPDLIKNVNGQVAMGLDRISSYAPNTIKPRLQNDFANTMIAMNNRYQLKMINEQKEDAKNRIIASMSQNLKNITEIGMSGNYAGAEQAAKNNENLANMAVNSRQITPEARNNIVDSSNKAAKSTKYIALAMQARDQGKYEEFAANFAKSKPEDLTYDQWFYTGNAIQSHIGLLDNLRAKDEALKASDFHLSILKDVGGITGAQIQDYKESVSPKTFADSMITYQTALNKANKQSGNIAAATADLSNPNTMRNHSDKALVGALDSLAAQKNKQDGVPLYLAEAQVAASAAGPIKGYIAKLDTKAQFGTPQELNEAIAARDLIASSGHPGNVFGLKPESNAMMNNYLALKGNHDEATAAAMAREVVYNNNPQKAKALDESYAQYVKNKKKSGETDTQFALRVADIDKDAFVNVPELNEYVKDKFASYYRLNNGNVDLATKQLKEDINATFDYDTTNGRKQFSLFPIKKMFNLPENSNGFIHADMKEQVDAQLKETKDLYDKHQVESYWEIKPTVSIDELHEALTKVHESFNPKPGQYKNSNEIAKAKAEFDRDKAIYQSRIDEFKNGKPPIAIQHWRDGHIEEYNLEIRAEPQMSRKIAGGIQGAYDVRLTNKDSNETFTLVNPNQTIIRYVPNEGRIKENYLKVYPIIEASHSVLRTFGGKSEGQQDVKTLIQKQFGPQ